MPAVAPDRLEELRQRLFDDCVLWAKYAAKIVDKRAQLVPLVANSAQLRFEAALEEQRAAGRPMRAIVLKARKLGFSTWVQARIMHRITQRPHRRAMVVGQDNDTASVLFQIGERIWQNLPPDPTLALRPRRAHSRRGKYMGFGEPARLRLDEGVVGLDSSLEVDTANEVEAGRGYTFTELHCSEVAFWPDSRKLLALLNAVPDEPETLVVLESTANGSNHFRLRWEQAIRGESSYVPIFAAWLEDPDNQLRFDSEEEREEFVAGIGEGPWGEDEPRLVEEFGCTPEQLRWRRQTIVDRCDSKLETFKQEFPASWEEAFVASGRHVFSMSLVSRVLDRVKRTDPKLPSEEHPGPALGVLEPAGWAKRKTPSGVIDVPTGAIWTPRGETGLPSSHPFWRVWGEPDPGQKEDGDEPARPKGAYVVAVDPAEGDELTETGDTAFHAIEVIDHRTREQVAEYQSRIDAGLVAIQAYLAALYWNRALLTVEKTGGYGLLILQRVWRDYNYPRIYRQRSLDKAKHEKFETRLGWDTNRASKALLEDGLREVIRDMPHAIRSRTLAMQFTTYVRDEKGRTGPEPNEFADLLMAFAIGQQVAQEWPAPTGRPPGAVSSTRPVRDPVTGY